MTQSNRNHEYLYTVEVRREFDKPVTDSDGNVIKTIEGKDKTIRLTAWDRQVVTACNIHEVAGKLHLSLIDIRYINKEILK